MQQPTLFESPQKQTPKLDDICRNRHQGNAESEQANAKVHHTKENDRVRIVAYVLTLGRHGSTCYENEVMWGKKRSTLSARYSELKKSGRLIETTRRRPTGSGCMARVFVTPEFATPEDYMQVRPEVMKRKRELAEALEVAEKALRLTCSIEEGQRVMAVLRKRIK